eukprot:Tamp_35653.p2 GENE.Tamp_35653~~Tamp_35653.p2  ORF type:complete len:114 (+),score=19.27 Tamp_35653:36-344(+)
MWSDVEDFVHARADMTAWHTTASLAARYGTITRSGGWGEDSSSAGFMFAPVDLYKDALAAPLGRAGRAPPQQPLTGIGGADTGAALANVVGTEFLECCAACR